MSHGQDSITLTADFYEDTALFGLDRFVAEAFIFFTEIVGHFLGKSGRAVDGKKGFCLF